MNLNSEIAASRQMNDRAHENVLQLMDTLLQPLLDFSRVQVNYLHN